MLKVKSFKITDGESMSEFLAKYPIASGAHVFVSNGEMAIPYEDGEPLNKELRIVSIKEKINAIGQELDLIIHSQKVLEVQNTRMKALITKYKEELIAPITKKTYDKKKELEAEIKRLQNVFDQNANQMMMNQAEITLKQTNVSVFIETLDELNK